MTAKKSPIKDLLVKFGVKKELVLKMDIERATKKLTKRLASGVPDDLTTEERAVVEGLGFSVASVASVDSEGGSDDDKSKNDDSAQTTESKPDDSERWFKMTDSDRDPEFIAPSMAVIRNRKRKEKGLVGVWEETEAPSNEAPIDKALKSATTTKTAPAAPAETKQPQATKKTKVAKAANESKPKREAGAPRGPREKKWSGMEAFRAAFAKAGPFTKTALQETLTKAGLSAGQIHVGLLRGQRDLSVTDRFKFTDGHLNPLDFQLEQAKNKEGEITYERITK